MCVENWAILFANTDIAEHVTSKVKTLEKYLYVEGKNCATKMTLRDRRICWDHLQVQYGSLKVAKCIKMTKYGRFHLKIQSK